MNANVGVARVAIRPLPIPKEHELSERDWQIIQMIADGFTLKAASAYLQIRYEYMKHLVSNLYDRTGTWTMGELVAYGFRKGKVK